MADNSQLDRLVQILKEARKQLDDSSKSAENLDRILNNLGQVAGQNLTAGVASQINKLLDSIENNLNARIRIMGERLRTSDLSKIASSIPQQAAGPANQPNATTNPPVSTTPGEKLDDNIRKYLQNLRLYETAIESTTAAVLKLMEAEKGEIATYEITANENKRTGVTKLSITPDPNNGKAPYQMFVDKNGPFDPGAKKAEAEAARAEREATRNYIASEQRKIDFVAKRTKAEEDAIKRVQQLEEEADRNWLRSEQRKIDFVNRRNKEEEKARADFNKELEKQTQKIKEQQERIAAARALPGTAGSEVFTRAQKFGFNEQNLQSVTTEASTGHSRLLFERENAGVVEKLTMTVDKFGNVLTDTQRRWRSFFDRIKMDIKEVALWGTAVGIVYGAMYKLQQVMGEVVTTQNNLIDATIAMGNVQGKSIEIFNAVAEAANRSGEGINDIFKGYAAAYRATGNINDATERFATTNKFLASALTLSKLAGMDEVEAIDLLAATMNQQNKSLDQATQTLDQWVAITKIANVTLSDLAHTISIVGEAGDAAGVSIEQLNGMTAVLASSTNMAGTELGNAVRAIVAGFQSDEAEKVLNSFGVSIRDLTTGIKKDVPEIIAELNKMYYAGQISSKEVSEIALKVGGGTRRVVPVTNIIMGWEKVQDIIDKTMNATGDSSEAMESKTRSLETALTRMSNALLSVAYTLGDKGGILEILTGSANAVSGLVNGIDKLISSLGKAGPLLIASGLIGGYVSSRPRTQQLEMVEAISSFVGRTATKMQLGTNIISTDLEGRTTKENSIGREVSNFMLDPTKLQKTLTGAVMGVMVGLQNMQTGKPITGVADILGGAIGGMALGPIGAAIGIAIADAFVSNTLERKTDLSRVFVPETLETANVPGKTPLELSNTQKLIEAGYAKAGGGIKEIGNAILTIQAFIQRNEEQQRGMITMMANSTPQWQKDLERFLGIPDRSNKTIKNPEFISPENLALGLVGVNPSNTVEAKAKAKEVQANQFKDTYGKQIEQTGSELVSKALDDYVAKNITGSAFRSISGRARNLPSLATTLLDPFMKDFMDANKLTDPKAAVDKFAKMVIDLPEEAITELSDMASKIQLLMEDLKLGKGDQATIDKFKELMQTYLINTVKLAAEQVTMPTFVNLDNVKTTQWNQVLSAAEWEFNHQLQNANLTPEQQNNIKESVAKSPLFIQLADGTVKAVTTVRSEDITRGMDKLEKAGVNFTPKDLGFNQMKINPKQYDQMMQEYATFSKKLVDEYGKLGFKLNEEETIVQLSDGTMRVMKADNRLTQVILSKIEENTKKLSGVYNLPSGMSLMLPSQALDYYRNGSKSTETKINPTTGFSSSGTYPEDQWKYQLTPSQYGGSENKSSILLINNPNILQDLLEKANKPLGKSQGNGNGYWENFFNTNGIEEPFKTTSSNLFSGMLNDLKLPDINQTIKLEVNTPIFLDLDMIGKAVGAWLANNLVRTQSSGSKTSWQVM
jgi:TP901 family phage tail tape measure protein